MQMEFTGERYVPELKAAKISYEHWHRYIFASRFCSQKRVLDAASGEGFGSSLLSGTAAQVSGIDISDEAVAHARVKYGNQNTEFFVSGASVLPFEKESFDVVVSFETLEHLTKEDQGLFLAETVRVLARKGVLLISTPNKKVYSDDANYSNPYHLSEFYRPEFESFLLTYYKNVTILNQSIVGGSLISRSDERVYGVEHIHMGINGFLPGIAEQKNEMEYMIAVCSQVESFPVSGSILLDDTNLLIGVDT